MPDLAELNIKIDSDQADVAMHRLDGVADAGGRAEDSTRRVTRGAQDMEKRFTSLVTPLRTVGALLAGIGATAALKGTISQFGDFEQALLGVEKTTDLTASEVAALGERMRELSTETPFAVTELLGLGQAAGQLGVTGAANINKFVDTVAKLGTASDLAGEEAATSLARILNVTGEAFDRVDTLASSIVALGNNFAATESEITRHANEVARSVAVYGVASEEAAALGATLASLGVRAELGGSSVGRAIRAIDASIREGGEAMRELARITNISVDTLQQRFEDDALSVFQAFLGGLGDVIDAGGSAEKTLEQFGLQGEEVNKTLPVLASRSDELGRALGLVAAEAENATALEEEYEKQSGALNIELERLGNTLADVGTELGSRMAPNVKATSEAFRGLIDDSEEVVDVMEAAGIVIGVNLAARTLPAMTAALWSATTASRALSASMAVFGGPLAAGITALAAGIYLVSQRVGAADEAQVAYNDAMEKYQELQAAATAGDKERAKSLREVAEETRNAAIVEQRRIIARAQAEIEGVAGPMSGSIVGREERLAEARQAIKNARDRIEDLNFAAIQANTNLEEMQALGVGLSTSFAGVADEAKRASDEVKNLGIGSGYSPNISQESISLEERLYGTSDSRERQREELAQFRQAQQEKLDAVTDYLMTREEREIAAYERRREVINTSVEDEQRRQELLERLEERHQQELTRIANEGATERQKFAAMSAQEQADTVVGFYAQMTRGIAQESRTMFEINKALAVAQAIINTQEAASSAYAYGSEIGGPYLGAAFAALAVAAQAARVMAIQNTSFTGTSGGTAPSQSTAGGGPSNPAVSQQQPQAEPVNRRSEGSGPVFVFNGPINANNIDELMEKMGEKFNNRDYVVIDGNSAQGRVLRGEAA